MSDSLSIETIESNFVIRFVRPEVRNPLSRSVLDELYRVLEKIPEHINKVIFTGSNGYFAAGADLREIESLSSESSREFAELGQRLMNLISELPCETLAAIDGPCYGGGLDLALACDRRTCSKRSTFCHPGAGLGIITGWGGTQRLPRLIGEANALEMFFTTAPIGSDTAFRIGLIDNIAEDLIEYAVNC